MTTIAEVLHRAADEFLWDGRGCKRFNEESCIAVLSALQAHDLDERRILWNLTSGGLFAMGLKWSQAFGEFPPGHERQAARYTWLKFAALIAEEQGA